MTIQFQVRAAILKWIRKCNSNMEFYMKSCYPSRLLQIPANCCQLLPTCADLCQLLQPLADFCSPWQLLKGIWLGPPINVPKSTQLPITVGKLGNVVTPRKGHIWRDSCSCFFFYKSTLRKTRFPRPYSGSKSKTPDFHAICTLKTLKSAFPLKTLGIMMSLKNGRGAFCLCFVCRGDFKNYEI